MLVEFPYPRFILGNGDREKHSSLPEEIHSFVGPILFFILGILHENKTKFRPQSSTHSSWGNNQLTNTNIIQVVIRSIQKK